MIHMKNQVLFGSIEKQHNLKKFIMAKIRWHFKGNGLLIFNENVTSHLMWITNTFTRIHMNYVCSMFLRYLKYEKMDTAKQNKMQSLYSHKIIKIKPSFILQIDALIFKAWKNYFINSNPWFFNFFVSLRVKYNNVNTTFRTLYDAESCTIYPLLRKTYQSSLSFVMKPNLSNSQI